MYQHMNAAVTNPLEDDLRQIYAWSSHSWPAMSGARVFITGGTGFIGTWMIESLLWAKNAKGIDIEVTVLSRDPEAFIRKAPHLAKDRALKFVTGDIRDFEFPSGRYSHLIHAATAASAQLNLERPMEMVDTIVRGSSRLFEFAGHCEAKVVLQTSTGGVYGSQPMGMDAIDEGYVGGPDPLDGRAAYSEAKRLAEMIGSIQSSKFGFEHKVARITALVGPHLPLDIHYALGNFMRDAMRGEPITIKGDGSPVRSYLYIADLVAWLWVIMAKGKSNRPYNAGSEIGMPLLEVAETVARVNGSGLKVVTANKPILDGRPNRYVPSTKRARDELGLLQWTDLETSIRKTFDWHSAVAKNAS